jgi:hypothetical protein
VNLGGELLKHVVAVVHSRFEFFQASSDRTNNIIYRFKSITTVAVGNSSRGIRSTIHPNFFWVSFEMASKQAKREPEKDSFSLLNR